MATINDISISNNILNIQYKGGRQSFSDLNHIQQNLWPYPNGITQGDAKFDFSKINSPNQVWNDYLNDIDNTYNNPLTDLTTYVSQFTQGSSSTNTLTFNNITITTKEYKLDQLTSSTHQNDEKYTLDVSTDGKVDITAQTFIGVGYALATLQQLIELDKTKNSGCCIKNLPINITDQPNTYYRNVMLDTGRTYFSTQSICDLLRNMGHHKMNYFDWHISDDQSFPLNVGDITKLFSSTLSTDPTFEGMTGGFDQNKVYNLDDVTKIINTARNYGITVVPGIDSPGHCSALMYGSVAATKKIFNNDTGMQIISSYELSKQGWLNAPEPIIGYLDLANPDMNKEEHDANIIKIATVIQVIFDEVIHAFQLSDGKYGDRINLNIDEVHSGPQTYWHTIYETQTFQDYLNRLLDIFDPTLNTPVINGINTLYKLKTAIPTWNKLKLSLWVDPIISENISGTTYKDNFQLKRFANRLTIGLWQLWNQWTPTVEQNNAASNAITGSEVVNYNANVYYMDSGYPGNMWSGVEMDYIKEKVKQSLVKYWISGAPAAASGSGYEIGFGKVYTYNFHYDYTGPNGATVTATGLAKLDNIVGAGLAVWTETITEGTLNSKLITNLLAGSEVMWKYNNEHGPDNVYHGVYRSYHQLLKLKLDPYNIISETPVYSGSNIMRQFPQGNTMDETNLPKENGNITQNYLSTNYKAWDITIRDEYKGMVNNNLMYNINPSGKGGNGANAIAQYPLSSKFMYGTTPQVSGANSEIYTRINPWLAEDINTLYNPYADNNTYIVKSGDYCLKIIDKLCEKASNYESVICNAGTVCANLQPGQIINYNCKGCVSSVTANIGRSNFASTSVYYKASSFYTDQRDAPIDLTNIIYYKGAKGS